MVNMTDTFESEKQENIRKLGESHDLRELSMQWVAQVSRHKYSYHFTWLGRPVIQFPQDLLAMQEIIWRVRPSLIVETGVARGGSLIFYASLLELIGGDGQVVGIDVDIREPNRREIEKHPMSGRITLLEGSSVDREVVETVSALAKDRRPILVVLDSNHTHEHVLGELESYSPLVTRGSYLVVFDTVIEEMPEDFFPDRPWGKGNNPKTAVQEFLRTTDRFVIDEEYDSKLLITVAPGGYLRCLKD
jgi:cephalosporin hydroxylase